MPPGVGIKGRDPHQTVDPLLAFQEPVGIVSLDGKGGAFHPGFFPGEYIQQFHGESLPFRIPGVHPQQHVGPVLGFGAAGPGMEGQDGVVGVILVAEEHAQFQVRQGLPGGFHFAFDFTLEAVVLFLHGHFPEGLHVFQLLVQPVVGLHFAFQVVGFLGHGLGLVRIIPEPGRRHLVFQVFDPLFLLGNLQTALQFFQFIFQLGDCRFQFFQ